MTTLHTSKKLGFLSICFWLVQVATVDLKANAVIVNTVIDLSEGVVDENEFEVNVSILNTPALSDTQDVIYTGVLRPMMDIDFSDLNNPIVNTLDFKGQDADIAHSDATFVVSLGRAELRNIAGSIYTLASSSPAPVTAGKFSSGDHEIIAWQGTIDIIPIIGGALPQIDVSTDFFRRSLGGTNDSTINVTLNNIAASLATYDVEIITPLNDVVLQTGDPDIDEDITITLNGNLVARGQFTHTIPEPASLVLIGGVVLLASTRRRRV